MIRMLGDENSKFLLSFDELYQPMSLCWNAVNTSTESGEDNYTPHSAPLTVTIGYYGSKFRKKE